MNVCKWCSSVMLTHIAPLPGPGTGIPLCASCAQTAIEDCYFVQEIGADPNAGEHKHTLRVNAKHKRIRGTDELKFKPRGMPRGTGQMS